MVALVEGSTCSHSWMSCLLGKQGLYLSLVQLPIAFVCRSQKYSSVVQREKDWVPDDRPCGGEHIMLMWDR